MKQIHFRSYLYNTSTVFYSVIVCGFLLSFIVSPILARVVGDWTAPEIIFETTGAAPIGGIALMTDTRGYLHLLYAHQPETGIAAGIDYMWWNGDIWSEPNNIIVNYDGSAATFARAALDAQQVIHLIWLGGGRTLYYASAPSEMAASPRAWSAPVSLGNAMTEPDIMVGSDNVIYVAYVDSGSGTVVVITSEDEGITWSRPLGVTPSNMGTIQSEPRIVMDTTERLHIVWTELLLPDGWPPTGAFYTHSTDRGNSWAIPLEIGESGYYGQISIVSAGQSEIHIICPSTVSGKGIIYQWSSDGGVTWHEPILRSQIRGFSGVPSFAIDTIGYVHHATAQAHYAVWDGENLSAYEDVATQEVRSRSRISSGERAVIAITSGNIVHVVFETDFKYLWHTWKRLDTPLLPTPTPDRTATPLPDIEPTPTEVVFSSNNHHATPIPAINTTESTVNGASAASGRLLLLTLAPTVFIVLVVILRTTFTKSTWR